MKQFTSNLKYPKNPEKNFVLGDFRAKSHKFLQKIKQIVLIDNSFLFYSCLVLIIAFFSYFFNYQNPSAPFWDENYHIASAEKYLQGTYFQEIHPPLGKLFIALGEKLLNPNSDIDKSEFLNTDYVTNFPQDYSFAGVRLFPSLFAFLGAYIFYLLLHRILKNPHLAFLLSSLYLFENAFIVHFRGAMLESTQMFFILLNLLFFIYFLQQKLLSWKNYLILGLLFGLVVSVKINGLVLGLVLPFLFVIEFWENFWTTNWIGKWKVFKEAFIKGTSFGLAFLSIFLGVHFLHINLANNLGKNTYEIGQQHSEGNEYLTNLNSDFQTYVTTQRNFWNPFNAVKNVEYWFWYQQTYNQGVPQLDVCKEGENGSFPLNWPVGKKAISYRWQKNAIPLADHNTYRLSGLNLDNEIRLEDYNKLSEAEKESYRVVTRYLYLQSNPINWFIALVGVILSFAMLLAMLFFGFKPTNSTQDLQLISFFAISYVLYFISVLQVDRVLYMYHYFIPLSFALIQFVIIFKGQVEHLNKQKYYLAGALFVIIFLSFLFYSPFSYFLPVTEEEFLQRVWFEFWGLKKA